MSKKRKKEETMDKWQERLNSQDASYINLPMNKEEYEKFCTRTNKCRSSNTSRF